MPRRQQHQGAGGDVDSVAYVRVGHVPKAGAKERGATVALYAGMTTVELQSVLRAALGMPKSSVISGFAVAYATSAKPRRSAVGMEGARERIVPITVACVSPEVLQAPGGSVRVLTTPPAASGKVDESRVVASQRLLRLVTALREEERSLSSFEAAVLSEICEDKAEEVLRVMQDRAQTLAAKKQFLLSLVRGNAVATEADHEVRAPVSATRSTSSGDGSNAVAQVDLICKKIVSIAHTVFSPHVQSDLMTEASLFREKQRKMSAGNVSSNGRGRSGNSATVAEANVGSIMELLGVVERLLNKHALQEEQSVKLTRLILSENRLLFSALQSYKLDYNLNELESTVKRMANLGNGSSSAPSAKPDILSNSSPKRSKSKHSSPRRKTEGVNGARKNRQGFIVRPYDILHTLYQKSMITTLELDLLRALVKQDDSQVLAAIEEYEQTRQLQALRDQLVAIVAEITVELGDDERMLMAEEGISIDNWQESLIQFVQRWFSLRKLTAEQVHVLRVLIEDEHNLLQSAFEVFATDNDENELLDTLQRIAKLQLQANEGALLAAFAQVVDQHCDVLRDNEKTLVKQLFARKNELARAAWEVFEVERNLEDFGDTLLRIARFTTRQDSKLRLVEVVGEMMGRELIASHEADGLIRLYEEKNEAMIAANEAFESDGDVKELVETLLLIVKHANFGDPPVCSSPRRKAADAQPTLTPPSSPVSDFGSLQIKSSAQFDADSEAYFAARLIEILASKGRLANWQLELLLGLLAKGDERVFATIDVYNEERDARELVDTLWRLCDLTAWEQNKAKILAQWIHPLERDGRVESGVLQKLMEARDDRLVAAFVVYLGDDNSDEFRDTLERLAGLEAEKARCQDNNGRKEDGLELPPSEEEKQDFHLTLGHIDGLNDDEISAIDVLISSGDSAAFAAFSVYQETQDEVDFVDTLKRIHKHRSCVE